MVTLCRDYSLRGKKQNYSQQPLCFRRSADVTSSSCYGWRELARETLKKPYSTSCWVLHVSVLLHLLEMSQLCFRGGGRGEQGGRIPTMLKLTYWHKKRKNYFLIGNKFSLKYLSSHKMLIGIWLKWKWNILMNKKKKLLYFSSENSFAENWILGEEEGVVI